ncbi:MAG: hypothetical protein WCI21_10145, partial [Alphaproteobacteria bacterium]
PLTPDDGLSHFTGVPLPCGSSATASAPVARRQSSASSVLDNGETGLRIDAVISSWEMNDGNGMAVEQPQRPKAVAKAAAPRRTIPGSRILAENIMDNSKKSVLTFGKTPELNVKEP